MVWSISGTMLNAIRFVRMGNIPGIIAQRFKQYRSNSALGNDQTFKRLESAKLIHVSCLHRDKIYVDHENIHAHSYLENNPKYSSMICKPIDLNIDVPSDYLCHVSLQDWSNHSPSETFDAFKQASVLAKSLSLDIDDPSVSNLCTAVANKCTNFEDSQLLQSLQYLSLWHFSSTISSGQFHLLWSAFDKACVERLKSWGVEMGLLLVDHWYQLKIARSSSSVKLCLKKISRKLHRLSPHEFVHLMFCVNLCRELPRSASQFEFVYTLESICNKLTLEELSVVAMGFFKTQTQIRNPRIAEMVLSRLKSCFESSKAPDSIMLASLLKVLRGSLHPTLDLKLHQTLDAMVPHLKNLSLLCCLHAALVGSSIQLFHEEVTRHTCERYAAEIKNARLKDIERLAFILTLFNYDPQTTPCIYDAMVAELQQRIENGQQEGKDWKEAEIHGKCLLRFLSYLTIRDIFPLELIGRAMDPDFLKMSYGKSWDNMGRELLVLDTSLEIRCPNHEKNRLSSKLRASLSKKYRHPLFKLEQGKKLSATDRFHVDILELIQSFPGAKDKVKVHQILTQFERPDIVFSVDKNGKFEELVLPEHDEKASQGTSTHSGNLHAVIVGGKNHFMKLSNQPIGPVVCKMSLLKKLGYIPTLIPWFEWEATRHTDKIKYLQKKIFDKKTQ